ncbi:MAG: hypothetical protein U9R73_00670 [Pseudomonadota bacterium]|nr:hypothetical protein [Pseudomonadota bacterium]
MTRAMPEGASQCGVIRADGTRCPRWTQSFSGDFICGEHWKRLTKRERRTWYRIRRTAKLIGWWDDKIFRRRWIRVWRTLKRRAAQ